MADMFAAWLFQFLCAGITPFLSIADRSSSETDSEVIIDHELISGIFSLYLATMGILLFKGNLSNRSVLINVILCFFITLVSLWGQIAIKSDYHPEKAKDNHIINRIKVKNKAIMFALCAAIIHSMICAAIAI